MIKALPVASPITGKVLEAFDQQRYEPEFPIELVIKDLRNFEQLLKHGDQKTNAFEALLASFLNAKALGWNTKILLGSITCLLISTQSCNHSESCQRLMKNFFSSSSI